MEKVKLDNGLLLIAHLTNILGPLIFLAYFGITYLTDPVKSEDNLIFLIPLSVMVLVSFIMFAGFRKVEFDDQYMYVKNVFNKEIDSFPLQNIRSVKKMMLSFNGKSRRGGATGKNYRITYLSSDGSLKKVKLMATISSEPVDRFMKATAFLGADGFLPE